MLIHVIALVTSRKTSQADLLMNCPQSGWIKLMPEAICVIIKQVIGTRLIKQRAPSRHAADQGQRYADKPAYINTTAVIKIKEHIPSLDFAPSDTSNLQEGQKVEHQKFGFGEVIKMEGAAHNQIATVKFEHNGEKKIMLNYAKLRIVM